MSEVNNLDDFLRLRNPPCIAEIIEGETVIINLDTGNYYNLLSCSSQIWQALNEGVSPRQLITKNKWDASTVGALRKFISTALTEGLLEVVTNPPPGASDAPKIHIENPETDISISIYSDMQELLGLDPIHETHETSGWPTKP